MSPGHVELLSRAVGRSDAVVSDPDVIASACSDFRGWYKGSAFALIRPRSVSEVQDAVRACHDAGIRLVPQGGNTSLVGGSIPDADGNSAIISLSGLKTIREVDPTGWSITAEAGVTLVTLQETAAANDRHFGIDLGARDSACVGGLVGTNAGGMGTIRYGSMRDQVLGLEVVLYDGSVWSGLRCLRKDNSGFDIKQLYIGSEGTLGIITAAALRLHPPERHSVTVLFALRDFDAINPSADKLISAGMISALELMPGWAMRMSCSEVVHCAVPIETETDWYLQTKIAGRTEIDAFVEENAMALVESGLAVDAVVSQSQAHENRLWQIRDSFAELHRCLGHSFRFDLSVPLGRIPQLIRDLESRLSPIVPGARLLAFGHLGDGNLHYSVCEPEKGKQTRAFRDKQEQIEHAVNETCWSLGGSISAEHGIGQLHLAELKHQKSALEIELQRRIKKTFDPQGTFNPNRLLP